MAGEIVVKWFEMAQTQQPMTALGAVFGGLRIPPRRQLALAKSYIPWAVHVGTTGTFLMGVYFERHWDEPISAMRSRLGITGRPTE